MEDLSVRLVGNKRKRTLSQDFQTCRGCKQRSYPRGKNGTQDRNAQRETREIHRPDDQWECCTCSNVEKPQLPQPAHTDDTRAETTLEVEKQRPKYFICLKTSLQAIEAIDEKDSLGDSNLESDLMTYYTDSDSDTEHTKYSSVASAAANTRAEYGGTTYNEAHETAHSIDANTSLDDEFSRVEEDTDVRHQVQAAAEDSKLTEERGQMRALETSDEPKHFALADIETPQSQPRPANGLIPPQHLENANKKDQVRGQSQPQETIQLSEQCSPAEVTQEQQVLCRTPLVQPFEQDTDNGTGQEGTLSQPSDHMSSDANSIKKCNQLQNVPPGTRITKEIEQLCPPGSSIQTQDTHSLCISTASPTSLDEADPPQSSSELPKNSQRTGSPPPFLQPRCYPSPAYTLPPSALLSQSLPLSTSLSSQVLGQPTNGNTQTSLELPGIGRDFCTRRWNPSLSFQKRSTSFPHTGGNFPDYEENGRMYHGYRKGIYMFPCDEEEKDRMDIFHQFFNVALRGALHSAPFIPNYDVHRVLDLGTGTGIWASDMAEKYPNAEVTGFDISLIQPQAIPTNLQFRRRDFEATWHGLAMDSYDLIHLRMLAGSISSYQELYANIIRHLKPSYGWIEHVEIDFTPKCDDGSLPRNTALLDWLHHLMNATQEACKPMAYNTQTRAMLQYAGFIEVAEQVIRIPFNPWPSSPHEKSIGRWFNLGLCQGLEALTLGPLTRIRGWNREGVDKLVAGVKREICTKKYHVYCEMHIWTARRPASNPPFVT